MSAPYIDAHSCASRVTVLSVLSLLFVLVVALGLFPSVVYAQEFPTCNTMDQGGTCADEGRAALAAQAAASNYASNPANNRIACPPIQNKIGANWSVRVNVTPAQAPNCTTGTSTPSYLRYYAPAGACSARLDGDAGMINGTMYSGGVCDNGCKVNPNLSADINFSLRESGNSNSISIRSGTWKATGGVCSADGDQKPNKKDEFCHKTSSGHTVCKSKDKTCVSTASGFRTCSSDTGNTKGHTATNNSRTEGIGIGAPNTAPNAPSNRPGENWQPSGGGSNVTNNNTGSTTNNNTYNNNGTPNGNQAVPGDGSGPGQGGSNGGADGDGGGEGDGEPDYGSVGGDGQCKGSFTCTGGDPVLCAIAQQTYLARCEADGRFGEGEGAGSFPGDGDGGAGEDPDPAKTITSATPSLNVIDKNGFFGGGSCPAFEVASTKYGAFTFADSSFCEVLPVARACFLFFGAFMALGILMGWGTKD